MPGPWIERRPRCAMAQDMPNAVETGLVMALRQAHPGVPVGSFEIEWLVFDGTLKRCEVWQPDREVMPEWARNVLVRGRVAS